MCADGRLAFFFLKKCNYRPLVFLKSLMLLLIHLFWGILNTFCLHPRVANSEQPADLSSLVSEGFVRFFVELVGHYPLHMVESSNGNKELQRDSFRKSHPSRGVRQFLQLFMDTQMFAGFIQDKELRKGGGRGPFAMFIFLFSGTGRVLKKVKLNVLSEDLGCLKG